MADDQSQFDALRFLVGLLLRLRLQLGQAVTRSTNARLEVALFQEPVFIGIDQAREAAFDLLNPRLQMHVASRFSRLTPQATLILALDPPRILQQGTNVLPYRFVQHIGAHRLVVAHPLATESVSVRSNAAVIRIVPSLPLSRLEAHRFPIECIVATTADNETLKQILGAAPRLPVAFPILFQSFFNGSEKIFADNCRNWNRNPLILGHLIDGDRPSRLFWVTLLCPQTRPFRPDSPLTEDRVSTIR
jgi:hypothetical protein